MKHYTRILTLFLFISFAFSQTQLGSDIDGEAAGDNSGTSVSMNATGDRVAIGAYSNDGTGSNAGHVRVYEYSSSWTQLGSDIDGEAVYDFSGVSVSMNSAGDRVAIGASGNDGTGNLAGHVRVYGYSNSSWTQLGSDIDGEAAVDYSGQSVSMNSAGDRVAIGAYNNDGTASNAGHVRIYEYSISSWIQLGSDIDGEAELDNSGTVSMNSAGDRVAIGAGSNDGTGNNAGHVRVYSLSVPFQPQTTAALQTAVDLWVSDSASAVAVYGDINSWDVSLITDMSNIFNGKETFNDDISAWDVSSVTDMVSMFSGATDFNQDLSSWNTSSVTLMNFMFGSQFDSSSFNQDLSSWDVSNVTSMAGIFYGATDFNQDLSSWDVSNVTDMKWMFDGANNFNGDISTWNVSNVTDMGYMFYGATDFNQDLSSWDVSNVTSMSSMFRNASIFNQDLSSWDVSNVTDMRSMFDGANNFNGDISTWNVSNVSLMSSMFWNAVSFNSAIGNWDVSNVTTMFRMFTDADSFNQDLSAWNVSSLTSMGYMFEGADSFNQDLSAWDVSSITSMPRMFALASSFNEDLSTWNVSNVTNMMQMFANATSFNQDLSAWDVSNVTDMFRMFTVADSFNQDLSAWDVSSVTNMSEMFDGANALSDENKCAIHTSFSSNSAWPYDWSSSCALTLTEFSLSPEVYTLHQNYPNPFNPITTLRYDLPVDALVNITICDMMGRVVKTLINDQQTAGYKSIQWNATNDRNEPVSAGLYLYTIQAGEFRQTKKMVLLK